MKGFMVLAAMAVLLVAAKGDENLKEKFDKTFNKCKDKHPISDDEVQKLKMKDIDYPYSHDAKCLISCFFEEGKLIQNGKYNKENALVMADLIHKDNPENAAKGKQIVETCIKQNPEVGPDQCEFAYKLAICGAIEAKKMGLEKTEFFK